MNPRIDQCFLLTPTGCGCGGHRMSQTFPVTPLNSKIIFPLCLDIVDMESIEWPKSVVGEDQGESGCWREVH